MPRRFPFLPWPRKNPFVGWSVVGAGFVLQVLASAALNQTFGAYFVQIQREFGWSRTVLTGSYSLLSIVNSGIGPVQGRILDRVGSRRVATVGLLLFGSGLIAFAFVHNLWQYYAVFLVMAVGSALSGFLTVLVIAANWFTRRRTTAIAVIGMGLGCGGLLVPIVAYAINHFGWRETVLGSGVLVLVVGLPLTRLLRTRPEDYGLLPDGDTVPASPASSHPLSPESAERERPDLQPGVGGQGVRSADDFTVREAVRTRAFWFIGLGHASALLVVSTVNVHFINYLVEQRGFSLQRASLMFSLVTASNLVATFVGGIVADRMEKRTLAVLGMVGHLAGMFILAIAANLGMVILFTVIHGLAWGLRGPLMASIRADYFGRSSFGAIMGLSGLLMLLGSVGGPLFAAFLADTTGDYRLAFIVVGILSGFGSLFFLSARKPAKPKLSLAAMR